MSRDSPIGLFTVYFGGQAMKHESYYVTEKNEILILVEACLNHGFGFDLMYFEKEN